MLKTLDIILQECEKHGYKVETKIYVHRKIDGSKEVLHVAEEFVRHLGTTFGGHVQMNSESVEWRNSEYSPTIGCVVFAEKPVVMVPTDEYQQMKEELERLRAEKSQGAAVE